MHPTFKTGDRVRFRTDTGTEPAHAMFGYNYLIAKRDEARTLEDYARKTVGLVWTVRQTLTECYYIDPPDDVPKPPNNVLVHASEIVLAQVNDVVLEDDEAFAA